MGKKLQKGMTPLREIGADVFKVAVTQEFSKTSGLDFCLMEDFVQ